MAKYGWTVCGVCGKLGIAWTTEMIPSGENLEMESTMKGWIHPSAEKARMEIWDKDKMLDHPHHRTITFRPIHESSQQHNRDGTHV